MITRIAHICLNVKSLEKSLEFYQRLGFKSRFAFTRQGKPFGAYLEIAPGNYIEMFEDPSLDKPINTGLAHFCLETDDMNQVMADLDSKGIYYTPNRIGCDYTWQIWLEDPDGNKFEMHQYTPNSLQLNGGTVEADW